MSEDTPFDNPVDVAPGGRDAVAAIDALIGTPNTREGAGGCVGCRGPLDGSPSDTFCSEDCQTGWHDRRTGMDVRDGGAAPDVSIPETLAPGTFGWLGPPPPGVVQRNGDAILDDVRAVLCRFTAFPDPHAASAIALWAAHTHIVGHFYVTARLVLDSAEPGSGKTRVLEVLQFLVAAPEMTISATPAALFRMVSEGPITILFDEVDTIFNAGGATNEDLRGLLNAGYKRSATIARCVGDAKAMKVQRFPVFAPAALAGIAGNMPATITTRAITVHMRRRRSDETVAGFRERDVARDTAPLREELATWAHRIAVDAGNARPDMPDNVTDRPAEIWEPLLAIADQAGGHWPDTARDACRFFVHTDGPQLTSTGIRLLADLREVFTRQNATKMHTADIVAALLALDDSPWHELDDGRAITALRISKELGRYHVKPRLIRVGEKVSRGYQADGTDGLADAWARYLPPRPVTAVTAVTPLVEALPGVTGRADVTDRPATPTGPPVTGPPVTPTRPVTPHEPLTSDVTGVTGVTGLTEDTHHAEGDRP